MQSKKDQLIKLATTSNSSKDFNQIMKQIQELQKEEEMQNQKQPITAKIEKLLSDLASQSKTSKDSFPLMKMILELSPLMDNINELQEQIKDSDSLTLYLQYRSVIKSFEDNSVECEKVSKESMNAQVDPKKMSEIKGKLADLFSKVKQLHTAAQKSTQKYILWMDKKTKNNFGTLAELQKSYSGFVLVQYYDNDDEFRKDVVKFSDQPCVIMMSGVAAGSNIQWGDGDHFNFLKKNQKSLRIMGCVIYCGQQGLNNLKHLLDDESKLIKNITTSEKELLDIIHKLLIPSDYKRVILLDQMDFFIPTLKKELINVGLKDYSGYDLVKLNPEKKKLQENFKKAKELIIQKKVNLKQQVIENILNIPDALQNCFEGGNSNKQIAAKVLRLYTEESSQYPVYNFLNATMNILNEELIFLLKEFYFIFILALYHYDDSGVTAITPDGSPTTLYRGSSIPTDHFDQFVQLGNYIVLPSFSSFTTKRKSAYPFMQQNTYQGTTGVMFEFQHKTGKTLYPNRPKNISQVSLFPNEDEYILYPFSAFRIVGIEKFDEYYYNIKLSIQ